MGSCRSRFRTLAVLVTLAVAVTAVAAGATPQAASPPVEVSTTNPFAACPPDGAGIVPGHGDISRHGDACASGLGDAEGDLLEEAEIGGKAEEERFFQAVSAGALLVEDEGQRRGERGRWLHSRRRCGLIQRESSR